MHPGMLTTVVRSLLVSWFRDNVRCPISEGCIEVMPDGRPATYSGDFFIAIYASDWSSVNDDTNVGLDYSMGVTCNITQRTTSVPNWSVGKSSYAKAYNGLSATCLEVIRAVSQKTAIYAELKKLPEYLYYDNEDAFIGQMFEFLRFQSADPNPIPVYADHFRAKNEHLADEAGESIMGYTMSVTFGKARCGIVL